MSARFTDRVVTVTGGASGIGRAVARRFATEGAIVAVAGRRVDEGEAVAAEIVTAGGRARFYRTDVADARSIDLLFSAVLADFGRIDIGFNNAGQEGALGIETADYDDALFEELLQVNLTGVFRCMQRQIRIMLKQEQGGVIVNTGSAAGLRAFRAGAGYTASKWGLTGITQAAALEYAGRGIRVNGVCPGVIMSQMAERAYIHDGEFDPGVIASHPIGRIGTADEVANAVLWLASAEAAFVTGAMLPVDGGALLQ